jgi:hypothetical protein
MSLEGLAEEFLEADEVTVIGVLPAQFTEILVALDGKATRRVASVKYFTPHSSRILAYRQAGVLGTLVQRWISGITKLRNWLAPRVLEGSAGADPGNKVLEIYEFDDLFLDCVLIFTRQESSRSAILTQLPLLTDEMSEAPVSIAVTVVSRLSEADEAIPRDYLLRLINQSRPLAPRQVRCKSDASGTGPGNEFHPVIARLGPYGQVRANEVEPIAVVGVLAPGPVGDLVVLKHRTQANARDDFESLSMISERVLADDIGSFANVAEPLFAQNTLDDLWIRLGKPSPFLIDLDAFRKAAQRELFLSCGLDVVDSRLEYLGSCLVDREDQTTRLGFYVFRLVLDRGLTLDELEKALSWNPELVAIPTKDIYSDQHRSRLNRLLRSREAWLTNVLFPGDAKGK